MSRAVRVKMRGTKGALPLPPKGTPSPAQNISNYDGRTKMNAGSSYEDGQFRLQDVQGPGNVVGWLKTVVPK